MKFKRTVTLAILAAVLSANMVACVAEKDPNKDPNQTYTDANGNVVTQQEKDPQNDPAKDKYEEVKKTVYISEKNSSLQRVDGKGKNVSVEIATELSVTGQSTKWYKVTYEGEEYYISRGRTTDDDLGEKTFEPCNKTMYVTGSVNVRPYPSINKKFSEAIGDRAKGDEVKVIKQSTEVGWSKVEYTNNGKTVQGFIKTRYLTTNPSGQQNYAENFTDFDEPKTVYVIADTKLSLRETPYLPDEDGDGGGTLVGGEGVARGTKLEAIAEGTVDGVVWYKVIYQPSSSKPKVECYGVKKYLSETMPSDTVDPEELIQRYNFKKFDNELTAYPVGTSVNIRTVPTSDNSKSELVGYVTTGQKMTAIAYGKSLTSDYLWCLVKLSDGKYGFASYDYLTTNSKGEKSPLPLSLDAMISSYGMTKINETKTSNDIVELRSTPDGTASAISTKPKGTSMKIVARGKVGINDWYIVEVDGAYYFAIQNVFD
ncbi:MAG TPA: hypothetical protein DDW30_02180 [Clostridiales bacterium]|nr:hypothetical protein [Clostridiales bacterium]